MLDTLVTSKTRIKLLLKFFLNPSNSAYLRSLEGEFEESSNGIRLELNKLEEADMLRSKVDGNKKVYSVNTLHPLYQDINSIVKKYLGLDVLVEKVIEKLGDVDSVYLTGRLAEGLSSNVIELFVVGKPDKAYLAGLVNKSEDLLGKKISYIVYQPEEHWKEALTIVPNVLLWNA